MGKARKERRHTAEFDVHAVDIDDHLFSVKLLIDLLTSICVQSILMGWFTDMGNRFSAQRQDYNGPYFGGHYAGDFSIRVRLRHQDFLHIVVDSETRSAG